MIGREQRYQKAGLPNRYWKVRPLIYVREEGLETKFGGIVEACRGYDQDVTYGVVIESRKEGIRPAFGAAVLKYLMALNNVQGWWRSFTRLSGFIRSTKFDQPAWDTFVDWLCRPTGQILLIENMSAKTMANLDDEERIRLLDFFQQLFQNGCLVIITTTDNQDRFEKMLGEDLAALLSDNLGTWGKLG
jgi:hypothetical protein